MRPLGLASRPLAVFAPYSYLGTIYGPMIGAFAFVLMQELFSNQAWFGAWAKHWQLAMGITIVLVALYLPQGLAGLLQKFGKKKEVAEEAEHD